MKNNETAMKKDFFSDRVREIFLRWKNECGKNKKKYLAGPYLFWSVSFTIIPLLMIFYYGLTDADGAFTFANIAEITTPCLSAGNDPCEFQRKSYKFSCVDLHPPNVDEFSFAYTCMADTA